MENIQNFLFKYETQESKASSERASVIEQFVDAINRERLGTKYKPVQAKVIAIRLNTVFKTTQELYEFLSICKDYKNRHGSFSRRFFGGFKKQNFNV